MTLIQRLKERKLVQWAVAYLAGAWVLFEVSDAVGGRWGLPDVIYQGLFILLVFGFFVTMVLAWYHGEKGRQRVSGPELLMVTALFVIAGVSLSTLGPQEEAASPTQSAPSPDAEDDRPAIAVLPFDNFSSDTENEFFAGGMHEQIISTLSKVSALRVISRTSVMQYGEVEKAAPQIADELGADFILEGSARIAGQQARLTAQLIDARRDEHIWADEYDRELSAENLFDVQGEVARQVAFAVGVALTPEDRDQVSRVLTDNTEAYLSYMRGNEEYLRERQAGWGGQTNPSIASYEQAIAMDAEFALAHARLALSLSHTSPDEGRQERVRAEAETALSLVPDLAEARVALGHYHARSGQVQDAITQYRLADEDSGLVIGARYRGRLERQLGEFDEAIRTLRRVESLDPLDPLIHRDLSYSYTFAHDYDEALREWAESNALDAWGLDHRAWLHLLRGEAGEARGLIPEILESDPGVLYRVGRYWPQRVLLRVLTTEERQTSLQADIGDDAESCGSNTSICLTKAQHWEAVGSQDRARSYWDSLRVFGEQSSPATWNDHARPVLVYLGLGRKDDAIRAVETLVRMNGAETFQSAEDKFWRDPAARVLHARVLAHFGEADAAIDLLEALLPAPSWLSAPVLEIDPIWDPLRDHPRFQALLEKYADDVEH